jgi:electron transfer flavoprotein beta subunit
LIICGKQTTDGDTAQVGPEAAEFLNLPHAVNVIEIIDIHNGGIRIKTDLTDRIMTLDIPFPCLITVDKDIFMPRLPSYKRKLASADRAIAYFGLTDLEDTDPMKYGLNGSPTQVEKVFPPESGREKVLVEGTGEESAEFLFQKLKELKFIG